MVAMTMAMATIGDNNDDSDEPLGARRAQQESNTFLSD